MKLINIGETTEPPRYRNAELDHDDNDYILMCAEYRTGLHNFTADYDEHCKNAREFRKALDRAGIKK